MGETITVFLGKIWAGFLAVLPVGIGSWLSATISKERVKNLTIIEKIGAIASGMYVGFIGGSAASNYWNYPQESFESYSIKFLISFFAVATLAELLLLIPVILKGVLDIIRKIAEKYFGVK